MTNDEPVMLIQEETARYFGVPVKLLLSADRHKTAALARHVAMYLCKKHLARSFPELAREFGNRDHTTVMSAVKKIATLRTKDLLVQKAIEKITSRLSAQVRLEHVSRRSQLEGIDPDE